MTGVEASCRNFFTFDITRKAEKVTFPLAPIRHAGKSEGELNGMLMVYKCS